MDFHWSLRLSIDVPELEDQCNPVRKLIVELPDPHLLLFAIGGVPPAELLLLGEVGVLAPGFPEVPPHETLEVVALTVGDEELGGGIQEARCEYAHRVFLTDPVGLTGRHHTIDQRTPVPLPVIREGTECEVDVGGLGGAEAEADSGSCHMQEKESWWEINGHPSSAYLAPAPSRKK